MNAQDKMRVVALVKAAGFWDWADTVTSFIPVVGSLKDAGKGLYHGATGQWGKALGDFAWAGAGLIPGASFARGGAKLVGTAGAKALGMGAHHASAVGRGLHAGTMAGIGATGDVVGSTLQPGQVPQPQPAPVAPQPQMPNLQAGFGMGAQAASQPGFNTPYGALMRSFAGNGFGTA